MDTWHILEQRFHEIGNRDHCLAMTFEKEDDEKYWYYLQGGPGQQYLGNGRWTYVLIGAPHPAAPVSPPTIERDDYCHSDLFETLQRAGRLINKDEGRSWSDWEGSRRFVKLLVQHYGSPVGLLFEDGDAKFFTNAARVCGMMAGKLANPKASEIRVKEQVARGSTRPNAARDSQWHDWRHIDGLTDAQIRDRWDIENPLNPVPRENAENGLGVVASAIRRVEKRKSQGTS